MISTAKQCVKFQISHRVTLSLKQHILHGWFVDVYTQKLHSYCKAAHIHMKLYSGSGGAITICVNGVLLNGSLTIYPLCTILNVMWCMALDFKLWSLARRNMKKQHTRITRTLKRKQETLHNHPTILFLCTHTSSFIWSLWVCVSCRVACVAQTAHEHHKSQPSRLCTQCLERAAIRTHSFNIISYLCTC